MGGPTPILTRYRAAAGGALVVVAGCVLSWALAYPASDLGASLARTVTDAAAVVTLGVAAVPLLEGPRHRHELRRRAVPALVAASATWVIAELVRLTLAAAEAAGRSVTDLGAQTAVSFATDTAAGRAGLLTVLAAAVVCAVTATRPHTEWAVPVAVGAAAVGVVGHPLTGHLADSPVGGVAVAVHALAAALWCGVLAGLVLTVDHRGQWARVLPGFSRLSLACVAALLVGGLIGGVLILDAPAELYTTGYGRVLTAKVLLTGALVVLGWRNREFWLPAARTHRSTAGFSRSRAGLELALMAVALAAAATLSVTG
ncbi:copper resistance protein D [Mycolicibacterium parafortuitum]|uniref:Copper resistance protein D n=1 Tax=Mycolicibacterium parafortuitum TaxID=39692 RepID=A0A7I7U1K2_MYCPF|nr:CopD family protein [Mycolicibacterium parafortuitum]BBY74805.1 copper resistance protein D [Mycolicibacterium parafortuitum]